MFSYFWIKVRSLVYSRSCTSRGAEMRIGETFQSRHMIYFYPLIPNCIAICKDLHDNDALITAVQSLSLARTQYRCPEFQQTETNVQNKTMETEIKTRVSEWVSGSRTGPRETLYSITTFTFCSSTAGESQHAAPPPPQPSPSQLVRSSITPYIRMLFFFFLHGERDDKALNEALNPITGVRCYVCVPQSEKSAAIDRVRNHISRPEALE